MMTTWSPLSPDKTKSTRLKTSRLEAEIEEKKVGLYWDVNVVQQSTLERKSSVIQF